VNNFHFTFFITAEWKMNSEEENKRCVKVKLMYLQHFIIAEAKRNNIQSKNSMPQNVSL
jgi:hypothetical protein